MMWELVGAVVGAGLASGREIAAFFSRFGYAGYAGIAAAGVVLYLLGTMRYPLIFRYAWMEKLWKILLSALLVATGGAMLSGGGEVFALTLPVRGAYWLGLLVTLLFSWLLAVKIPDGLSHISQAMMIVLLVMIGLSLFTDPQRGIYIDTGSVPACLLSGIKYGGFNAALQASVLARSNMSSPCQRRSVMRACIVITIVLCLGNAVLLRQSVILRESLPFLKVASAYGSWGYCLFAAALYLAILSTLVACVKGVKCSALSIGGILIVSFLGFTGVVEWVYPLLGGSCFVLLLYAKFSKSLAGPFHS
ncbi:MAG: hypothetical protein E7318_01680 [Clostridiales bacterium]|nr:hypothetical protein [Clostridiales bacterium]